MKKENFKAIFGVIVFFIIIYFVFIDEAPQEENKSPYTVEMYEAKAIAENQVLTLLKSPGTAKFSDLRNTTFQKVNGGYNVIGFVDAQNSFGATLRSNYSVEVLINPGGKYTFRNLKLGK